MVKEAGLLWLGYCGTMKFVICTLTYASTEVKCHKTDLNDYI